MTIVKVTNELKEYLKKGRFNSVFLDNCLNSKFLAIEKINQEIVGASFVGGLLNSNGIEILGEFRGKGLGKKLLEEIMSECKRRKISFLTGVFKPNNTISIKTHIKIGYVPLFTIFYNKKEGREIVVFLPFDKKGTILMNMLRIFNTRFGNIVFALLLRILQPLLKDLIAFSGSMMPKIDLLYSLQNFEKVQKTLAEIKTT